MVKDLIVIIAVIMATKYFILDSVKMNIILDNPTMLTAIICSAIAFMTVICIILINRRK